MFNIIKKSKLWILIGWLGILWSLFLFFLNMNLSIQFTWWIEFKINVENDMEDEQIKSILEESLLQANLSDQKNYEVKVWTKDWYKSILLKSSLQDDMVVNKISETIIDSMLSNSIIKDNASILEISVIWPSVWNYIKQSALTAIVVWLIFMALYILFSFSSMKDLLSPLLLWIITVLTIFFDISIAAWWYGLFMAINSTIQIDTVFIISILTVMGYSINDTIVIFDRIRENYGKLWWKEYKNLWEVFEKSLWQTMRRSIMTSLSTLFVIISMFIFWTWALKTFAFTLGIGIIAWTYSSIFIAAPLAYLISGKQKSE